MLVIHAEERIFSTLIDLDGVVGYIFAEAWAEGSDINLFCLPRLKPLLQLLRESLGIGGCAEGFFGE